MARDLRALPSMNQSFGGEVEGQPIPEEFYQLLHQFWPECFETLAGQVVMAAEDSARLEQLFETFGVPLKVSENRLATLGHAYDVFVRGLTRFVRRKLRHPDNFDHFLDDWPTDWIRYVEAVAAQDMCEARRYAKLLQPLSPDCQFPPGISVAAAGEGPLGGLARKNALG